MNEEEFKQLSEKDLREKVLIPLFEAMGYSDVEHYHGGENEKGKDIVFWDKDRLGQRKNYAVVVKAGKITGQARVSKNSASEVEFQIRQAIGSPFLDPATSAVHDVDECWVISNQEIQKQARDAIYTALKASNLEKKITFLQGSEIWRLVRKHLWSPANAIAELLSKANELDSHYIPKYTLSDNSVQVELIEKFPGASEEKPIEGKFGFVFPETEEGQEKLEELKQSFESGMPATIPSHFIHNIEMPEFAKLLLMFPDKENLQSLSLLPIPDDKIVYCNIIVKNNSKSQFTLQSVPFKIIRVGSKEISIENDNQPSYLSMQLSARKKSETKINISINLQNLNAKQLLDGLKLKQFLSSPFSFRLVNSETNIFILQKEFDNIMPNPPDETLLEFVGILAEVQQKTGQVIKVPVREYTKSEIQTVFQLKDIISGKPLLGAVGNSISINVKDHKEIRKMIDGEHPIQLAVEQICMANLFDQEISLGKQRIHFPEAQLTNRNDLINFLEDQSTSNNEVVTAHFEALTPPHITFAEWTKSA